MLGAAASSVAHPIVIHTGDLHWEGASLRLVLALDSHSMGHETIDGSTPQRVAQALADSIHVVSHVTGRVTAPRITATDGGKTVTCNYRLADSVSTVALMHRPGSALAPLARQFQLRWRAPGASHARIIRLTSGGNHAVLRRDDPADNASCDPLVEPVFRLDATDGGTEFTIEIDYPCALLASWPGLVPCRDGTVTWPLFRRSRRTVSEWAGDRLSVSGANGRPRTLNIDHVDLLGPSGESLSDAGDTAFSVHTTHVRIRSHYVLAEYERWTEFTWTGFNSTLLGIPVTYARAGSEPFVGVLTPTHATLRVPHSDLSAVSIRRTLTGKASPH
jgi:hypothetical protein